MDNPNGRRRVFGVREGLVYLRIEFPSSTDSEFRAKGHNGVVSLRTAGQLGSREKPHQETIYSSNASSQALSGSRQPWYDRWYGRGDGSEGDDV
jgi:hypothetical protein